MKLNIDCIREILIQIEKLPMNECVTSEQLCKSIPDYTADEVNYNALKLMEADYLNGTTASGLGRHIPAVASIKDITFTGHEFLNTIRETTQWEKVKDVSKKIGVSSLQMIGEIAKSLGTAAIQTLLQHHL